MAQIRIIKNKDNPYLTMNTTAVRDDKMSRKAKWLHTYMLSMPDNWSFNMSDLSNRSKDWHDATVSWMSELISLWYVIRTRVNDQWGKFHYDYDVYEIPQNISTKPISPWPIKPCTVDPCTVNPWLSNIKESSFLENTYNMDNNCNNNILPIGINIDNVSLNLLIWKYWLDLVELSIKEFSEYLKKTRKTYKSHYLAVNNWIKSKQNDIWSDQARQIYEAIKRHATGVDWSVRDCQELYDKVSESYPMVEPVSFIDQLLGEMKKAGLHKYHSIASPKKIMRSLVTLMTKTWGAIVEASKPSTVKIVDGKIVLY